MDNWIDIKELPKDSMDIIVQDSENDVYTLFFYYINGKPHFFDENNNEVIDYKNGLIKYWQPLPKPRK